MYKSVFAAVIAVSIVIYTLFSCSKYPVVRSDGLDESQGGQRIYIGTNEGLFQIDAAGRKEALWTEGSVRKILSVPGDNNGWFILGSEGIFFSSDLRNWEERNEGLTKKVIKVYEDANKSFLPMVQEIKDVKINPTDPNIMVCATKDRMFLTRDQGRTWTDIGRLRYVTNGIKSVASAFLPELTVFVSHSIYGIHYLQPDVPGSTWTYFNDGIENLESTTNPDEVADISVKLSDSGTPEIYISQTFRRRIYKLDWDKKVFNLIWRDNARFGTVDSLFPAEKDLYFLHEGTVSSLNFSDLSKTDHQLFNEIIRSAAGKDTRLNCIVIDNSQNKNLQIGELQQIILSELWLLDEPKDNSGNIADNKEGFFLPMEQVLNRNTLNGHLETMRRAGLNMVLIDGKDEQGRLRFTPNHPTLRSMGTVFSPLDLDAFTAEMKRQGIYTVARIVVFKDQQLFGKENGRYAVWNARTGSAWRGYDDFRRRSSTITDDERARFQVLPTNDPEFEILRSYYNEHWLDPYSEEVWEYIALISIELYERGVDEIQYDYIRFPTDGHNLGDARFRWQDPGMDMESALLSFFRHVRNRVKAPISIDIYGANGWYRTGARTGQEVELLAPWVDVICPMYYPSHFEQNFLAQHPAELRPWRIYYHGTLRTARISRGQVIIRPWAQAFYLSIASYDRQYYNPDYVRRQIEAVREAGTGGYTYWNNIGRYGDIPNAVRN